MFSIIGACVSNLSWQGTQGEWRTVFLLTGGISAFGGVVYLIFGKGGVQEWATSSDEDNGDESYDDIREPLIN